MIDPLFEKRRILIVCGTGGVGKTTLSSALGLRAAQLGKRVLVITIDPAKRLATSLGLKNLGTDPEDLTTSVKKSHPKMKGRFSAVMPDPSQVFEKFVYSISPTDTLAKKVLNNPIYQVFSKEFAGANEYMAVERLYAFEQNDEYDLIILDTPPSRNALSFLDAPELLLRFFDEKLIQWLVNPSGGWVAETMKKAFGLLEKLTGGGFVSNLFEFAESILEVQSKFATSLRRISNLLKSEEVGFLLVTTPRSDNLDDLKNFRKRLDQRGYHFDGFAINRSLIHLKPDTNETEQSEAAELIQNQITNQINALKKIETTTQSKILTQLPELARDIHTLKDLIAISKEFE